MQDYDSKLFTEEQIERALEENNIRAYFLEVDFKDLSREYNTGFQFAKGEVNSGFICFKLLYGESGIILKRGCTVYANIRKTTGETFKSNLSVLDYQNGIVLLPLSSQVLSIVGADRLELAVVIDEEKTISPKIKYNVYESFDGDDKTDAENHPPLLDSEDLRLLITELRKEVEVNKVNIEDLTEKNGSNLKLIQSNTTKISSNTSEIEKIKQYNTNNDSKISNIENSIEENTNNISTNTNKIGELENKANTNESNISSNASKIELIEGEIETLKQYDSSNDIKISEIESKVDTNKSGIANNSSKIEQAISKIEENKTNISGNSSKISVLENKIPAIESRISGNTSNISTVKTKVEKNTSDITKISKRLDGLVVNPNVDLEEIVQARTATTGEVFDTLDERIDCEVDRLNKKIDITMLQQEDKENHLIENTVDGMTTDMIVKGKTLQNLVDVKNMILSKETTFEDDIIKFRKTGSDITYLQIPFLSKPNTTYTIMYTIVKNTVEQPDSENYILYPDGVLGDFSSTMNTFPQNGQTGLNKFCLNTKSALFGKFSLGFHRVNIGAEIWIKDLMILEGDWTNKPIPNYFEGIKSFGEAEGNKISILSHGKNLFDGSIEVGAWKDVGSLENAKYDISTLVRNTNPIKIKPNTQYIMNVEFQIRTNFYDKQGNLILQKCLLFLFQHLNRISNR